VAVRPKALECFAVLAALLALLLAAPALAQSFPPLTGRVVDQANLLSPEQELDLESKSAALEAQTGRQFVVASVNSLEGVEIADYATQLGRTWRIGNAERDDGVILLVAPNERKVWIATGYGAEGVLPDILAGRIIRDTILPRFRQNDMGGGIVAGADAILSQLSLSPEEARASAEQARQQGDAARRGGANILPLLFWGMVILFVLLSMGRRASGRRYRFGGGRHRRRRGFGGGDAAVILWGLSELAEAASRRGGRRGWGGGGFGGFGGGGGGFGGFSGGGGSFGGGGAGGSW
jgi:uncharacterized protein